MTKASFFSKSYTKIFQQGELIMGKAEIYDVIIIGGGPAGLTAGLYASRARLKTLMFEKGIPGGQASTTDIIENYPGFPEGISGPDLMNKFYEQAVKFGLEMRFQEVLKLSFEDSIKTVWTGNDHFQARTVIVGSGATPRQLGVPGEDRLRGRGVSYCATCDGAFFQDKTLAVVGGGDAAVEEALYLTRYARQVYLIHRRDKLRATQVLQEKAFKHPKICFIWNTEVKEILGNEVVEGVVLQNNQENQISELSVNGVFIYIGVKPNTEYLKPEIKLTPEGYIETNDNLETSVPGIFAVGDVRNKDLRQVVTAVSDGAVAIISAEKYLARNGFIKN